MLIPNEGLLLWLLWAFDDSDEVQEDFVLDLFQNNYTPVFTSTGANFTIATFVGYDQIALPRGSFSAPTAAAGVGTIVSSVSPTWNCTGGAGQLVYGWLMRGAESGKVLGCQTFPGAVNMVNGVEVTLGAMTWQMGQG